MYARQPSRTPAWLVVLAGVLLVSGAYFLWRGLLSHIESGGQIATPIGATPDDVAGRQPATGEVPGSFKPLEFTQATPTPQRPCQEFKVNVIRARIRECPRETCETLDKPAQGTIICVYGVAMNAPDWYEVNMLPGDPIPRIGYMHNSVIYPLKPTQRPSHTYTPLPTVTSVPTQRPTRTLTPPPTRTLDPAATVATTTPTPAPTATPIPPIQKA